MTIFSAQSGYWHDSSTWVGGAVPNPSNDDVVIMSGHTVEAHNSIYLDSGRSLMIQENDDPNIALDVLDCLAELVPAGKWRHDRIDDNGAAHIQAGLVGPSETIPIREGELALSTWQNVFLCDFDGPRRTRRVLVTIVGT